MVSFQSKLAAGLARRGIEVCFDLKETPYTAVLVIGGTRQIAGLWNARRQAIRIVQRLDGMNWVHRVRLQKGRRKTSLRHFLRSEYGNFLLAAIRSCLAQQVVYQSHFSKEWWERKYGQTPVPSRVVYNGVDLDAYSPSGPHQRPGERFRLLLVEGSLMGGYEMGLDTAVQLAEAIAQRLPGALHPRERLELMVVGRVSRAAQVYWEQRAQVNIHWAGLVSQAQIPALDRSAHLLFSADVNAACPNSVIEALACGLPVAAFATGALPELVTDETGKVVPYGSDPWRLEPPDVDGLARAALDIFMDQERFRTAARARAEAVFGLDEMVAGYLEAIFNR